MRSIKEHKKAMALLSISEFRKSDKLRIKGTKAVKTAYNWALIAVRTKLTGERERWFLELERVKQEPTPVCFPLPPQANLERITLI